MQHSLRPQAALALMSRCLRDAASYARFPPVPQDTLSLSLSSFARLRAEWCWRCEAERHAKRNTPDNRSGHLAGLPGRARPSPSGDSDRGREVQHLPITSAYGRHTCRRMSPSST